MTENAVIDADTKSGPRRRSMPRGEIEREIILYSASTSARRALFTKRTDKLVDYVDWQRLAATLDRRRLLPILGPRIVEFAEGRESDDFRVKVNESIATGRRRGAALQLVALRALEMLAEAGIRASPLKGPLFGEAIYGDPGRRPSRDIDLLVPPSDLSRAVDIVCRLGYGKPSDYVYGNGLPQLHFELAHERGELPPIELHWRIHWYESDFARQRLVPPTVDPLGDWRPAPADELVALFLFYARDGFVDLRLASDLSAWWDVNGKDLPSGAVLELLDTYPALTRVILAGARVSESVVGLPAAQVIGGGPKPDLRTRTAARLANPHPRSSRAQIYADIGLIDGLLMPRGGLAPFVRRHLLPPSSVLRQQARHGARSRPRSPLARGAGTLFRYAVTLTRLVRPTSLRADWSLRRILGRASGSRDRI